MKKTIFSSAAMAGAFVATSLFSTGSALAACTLTEWTNILPGHPLPQVTGRVCDGDMAVNVIGADPSGATFDFGWSAMEQIGTDSFTAEFVDANATNKIQMDVNPLLNTMRMTIDTTILATSQNTIWYADYVLTKVYDQ